MKVYEINNNLDVNDKVSTGINLTQDHETDKNSSWQQRTNELLDRIGITNKNFQSQLTRVSKLVNYTKDLKTVVLDLMQNWEEGDENILEGHILPTMAKVYREDFQPNISYKEKETMALAITGMAGHSNRSKLWKMQEGPLFYSFNTGVSHERL